MPALSIEVSIVAAESIAAAASTGKARTAAAMACSSAASFESAVVDDIRSFLAQVATLLSFG